MNRLNARIRYWYEVAEAASQFITIGDKVVAPDRDLYAHAVKEQHAYCDIAEAIRTPNRRTL